jgi:hypothetical protein
MMARRRTALRGLAATAALPSFAADPTRCPELALTDAGADGRILGAEAAVRWARPQPLPRPDPAQTAPR